MVPTLGVELGAPVIQIQTSEGEVVTMPGFETYVAENGGGFKGLIGDFQSVTNPRDFIIITEELEALEVGVDRPIK